MKKIYYLILIIFIISCQNNEKGEIVNNTKKIDIKSITQLQLDSEKLNQVLENSVYLPKGSRQAFLNKLKKIKNMNQEYTFKLTDDTIIKFANGGKVLIPFDAFEFEDSSPITDSIKLEVQEFYSISEIILNNLTTTSQGKPLETAGMLFIDGNSNNKKIRLKKGKVLAISIPSKEKLKSNMGLYSGKKDTADHINWNPLNRSMTSNITWGFLDFEPANFYKSDKLQTLLKYPNDAWEKDIKGKVWVELIVDKNGEISNPIIAKSLFSSIDNDIIDKVIKLKGFRPARLRGKTVCSVTQIGADYFKTAVWKKISVINYFDIRNRRFNSNNIKSKTSKENLKANENCSKIYDFSVYDDEFNNQDSTYNYRATINSFGYYNCDGSVFGRGQFASFTIDKNEDVYSKDVIIVNNSRIILPGQDKGEITEFSNIPLDVDGVVVSIKYVGNKLQYAKKEVKVQNKMIVKMNYKFISEEDLKKELDSLIKT